MRARWHRASAWSFSAYRTSLHIIFAALDAQRLFTIKPLTQLSSDIAHGHTEALGTVSATETPLRFARLEIIDDVVGSRGRLTRP